MEILEQIWEKISLFFGGLLGGFERLITSAFGSSNARYIKKLQATVDAINELEPKYEALSDDELRDQTRLFKQRLASGETLDDILVEAFAVGREAGKRYLGMRHYDVQLIGGIVLHRGSVAEMVTGEGKTLVATLPAYLNAIEGKGVFVITVNDYLARRDMEWMAPLYRGLGLTVNAIQNDMSVEARQQAYSCDITYGTNNEFGFDYLRDNMRPAARGDDRFPKYYQQSQGRLHYAIIDEVDNILIDEARTPLIISGPANTKNEKYAEADKIARTLKKDDHFVVNEKDRTANLTEDGVRTAERLAGVESFYTSGNMEWPHLIDNALRAHYLYQRDVDYVVEDGKIIIVDPHTGRKMDGRQWSDGMHQAVEAKEGVKIKEETQTLATITLQNFFKLFDKLSGMTGTAMTEAGELWKIYKLDVIAIPTNREMQRITYTDVIFMTEKEKYEAVADEIERHVKWDVVMFKNGDEIWGDILKESEDSIEIHAKGQKQPTKIDRSKIKAVQYKGRPVLVGTVSIEKSERLSHLLDKRGIKHDLLNAKQHKREADIVAQAGRIGSVTIATNMAGRGTDIIMGGNPETMAWAQLQHKYATRLDVPQEEWDALVNEIEQREQMKEMGKKVKELGGLHVIGTERHESRRIDLQLRGRCGRQGDPGSSRFFLSLEDDLMRIYFGDWAKNFIQRMPAAMRPQPGDAIESRLIMRRIEGAQKKREEQNFEARKNLLEYDEVMDEQRKRVYGFRQQILEGGDSRDLIMDMVREQIEYHVRMFMEKDFGIDTFSKWAGSELSCELNNRDLRGMDFPAAEQFARDQAERAAQSNIIAAIDENLPDSEDESEWNWSAMARFANSMWKLNLNDRELKKVGRDQVDEFLVEKAREAIAKVDLSDGEKFLDKDFGLKTLSHWCRYKFGFELDVEQLHDKPPAAVIDQVYEKGIEVYDHKEAEYPVLTGLYKFSDKSGGHARLDRDGLLAWASGRFETDLNAEEFKSKQREEIQALLIPLSEKHKKIALEKMKAVHDKVEQLYEDNSDSQTLSVISGGNGQMNSLTAWIQQNIQADIPADELEQFDKQQLESRLVREVYERYRPEMTRMERSVLLELIDNAWKDHLLAMDHLRSAVSFVGYAQVDSKVEYKREGMRLFDQMWRSVGERVTDLVYKIESLNEEFVSSTWKESEARHDSAASIGDMAQQQEEAINNSQGEVEVTAPIRNVGEKIHRNDPCPCGSGKKYKACCMKQEQAR
ncbi:preprotein translocase subunit SecA [Blastopirellula marina]|uniref:Protein translocase subunit SecA n=1 Tax=Blastopirellula marina TaxID=124 RepID=A0A2S8F7P1_9BACT|nr:preprotein translocase subunit SecA [Blastopirellula marina]PQO28177.1 preprotein translocase subunit SecA [Blastopirellula marina]PTL41717.1 preprotein translocase subunit SecA [Blastopirellula marina]